MVELFDSISKGFPVGSLLFWKPENRYKTFEKIGIYDVPPPTDNYYVLDGFQRITTLFGVLSNPHTYNKKERDLKEYLIYYNLSNMMTAYERSDLIHIMKMNRLTLSDSDTAQLEFNGQIKGKNYRITILVVEDLPQIFIKRDGEMIYSETIKSIDDLKIFLEERLYKYLEV